MTVPPCVDPLPAPADLLAWYDRHARKLPWRVGPSERRAGAKPDPYRVWLSEIMLQQTTVKAAAPYYEAFVARWPNVAALAAAADEDVMRAWAGLGYYARARNLLACARAVARDLQGRFPETEEGLRALPGIGPYTAAAIAAIAFDRPAAAVDGNVERVVARLFAVPEALPQAKGRIRELAAGIAPRDRPGDFAQAMMDLGATICTPLKPACAICPWNGDCLARAAGRPEDYPRKPDKAARPLRHGWAYVARRADGAVLLGRRPPKGLLGGMSAPPTGPWQADPPSEDEARRAAPLPAEWRRLPEAVRHGFTHFELFLTVLAATLPLDAVAPPGMWWSGPDRLADEAVPTVFRKVLAAASGKPLQRGRASGPRARF